MTFSKMFYAGIRVVFLVVLRLFMGFRVQGGDRVPVSGPILVCGNHQRWLDPVVIACATRRVVFFMAKEELFIKPVTRYAFTWLGAYPVRRGGVDRAAVRKSIDFLRAGQAVGIFPEGTRSRTGRLGPGEPGAAVMALMTGAKVVPVGITGYGQGWRLRVAWGQPLDPAQFGGPDARRDREAVDAFTRTIMEQIASLIGQETPQAHALPNPAVPKGPGDVG
jgi:1-acyl-sn-glycerol-3-phosphate acyltransferase